MTSHVIITERLKLREMRKDDGENLLKIFSDPEAMRYYPSTKGKKETEDWINWTLDNYSKYKTGLWIVDDKKTGEFLGQCGLVLQEIEGRIEMEIGYLFVRRFWGKGYATEAAMASKSYGFKCLGLTKLISIIDIRNHRSVKVSERIGMNLEKQITRKGKEVFIYSVSKASET